MGQPLDRFAIRGQHIHPSWPLALCFHDVVQNTSHQAGKYGHCDSSPCVPNGSRESRHHATLPAATETRGRRYVRFCFRLGCSSK
jgi:hypothetical protein